MLIWSLSGGRNGKKEKENFVEEVAVVLDNERCLNY
jgi:hypothetical protein